MTVLIPALLAIHGAIHLLGFLKWSGLASVPQLAGRVLVPLSASGERLFAAAWLAAFVLLLAAVALRVTTQHYWWAVALAGVVVSQAVIALAWPDAKAGTIANVIIAALAIVAVAHDRFAKRIDGEAEGVLAQARDETHVVTQDELRALPVPVAKWLTVSGVVGRPRAATVRLQQRGELRTKPDAAWMPARAEQYFSIDPPGFVWRVDATMLRFMPVAGRDRYVAGHGHMLIKAASLLNVADAADDAIDRGSMLRYLAEIIWFPSAALATYISWEPIDDTHARATMRYAGGAAPAVFTFDDRGRALRFDAERPLGGGDKAKVLPWFGVNTEWRAFDGIEVPTRGEVGWQLPGGTFVYYRWEILGVEFNRAELFSRRAGAPSGTEREPTRERAFGGT